MAHLSYYFLLVDCNGWVGHQTSRISSKSLRMSSTSKNQRAAFRVLGITGGIGSGKSACAKMAVEELGCLHHIDADSIAHTVYRPGSQALKEIAEEFGSSLIQDDGQIDRQQLGGIVFTDPAAMSKLEQIVWPHVKTEIKSIIEEKRREEIPESKSPIVILEAAVLIDANWQDLLDGLWVIRASPEAALRRIMENRGLTRDEAQKRIDAQQSRRGIANLQEEVDKGLVTAVIDNNGSLEELKGKLQRALKDPSCWATPTGASL